MRWGILALILASVVSFGPVQAQDQTFTFRVQSNYRYIVQIEFYAQGRNAAWPGGGKAYNIKDGNVHDFRLNCRSGEKICYGAWASGNQRLYWGSGMHGRQACSKCCYICDGGESPVITLNN